MEQVLEKNIEPLKEKMNTNSDLNGKKRVIYYDILNILSCLCVIFLHMNGIVHNYSTDRAWKTALVFEVICFWAVPIFIMLSGATLFKYRQRYSTKEFFKKRFIKVLIPWIVWSLISYIIKNKDINILKFIEDFIYCRIEPIYWFFPLILYLYCLIPILSVLTEKTEYRTLLKAIAIFIFVFGSVLKPICVIFDITFPTIFSSSIIQSGYVMFLILGYLLSTSELSKKNRILIYILGISSAIFRYIYTYYMSYQEGILNRDLFDYCVAPSVFLAMAVFVFFRNLNLEEVLNKLKINTDIIAKLSSCSFGVYLIHIIVKNKLTNLFNLNIYSIWYRTVGAIALYLICVFIVYIIKKIPIVKKIVP